MSAPVETIMNDRGESLLAKDEDELLRELGQTVGEETGHAAAEAFGLPDLRELGRKLFNRASASLRGILCGEDEGDTEDRNRILDALKLGDKQTVVATLAPAIVAALGLSGAAAVLVATIIVGRLVGAAVDFAAVDLRDKVCATWPEAA